MRPVTAETFVDRVYRRLVILRTIEQFGLGILGTSVLATILNLLAIWQSMPTLPILLFSACLGILAGIVLTVWRWPTRLSAVSEADRQLRFDDLLTSALFPASGNSDDFSNIVRALADAKCQLHSPGEVFLRRLSARTWSTVGLALCAAVTLGVIPFGAAPSQAVDANAAALSDKSVPPTETSKVKIFQQINDPTSEGAWDQSVATAQKTEAAATQSKNSRSVGNGSSAGGGTTTNERNVDQKLQDIEASGSNSVGNNAGSGGASSGNAGQREDQSNAHQSRGDISNSTPPGWSGNSSGQGSSNGDTPTNDRIPMQDRDLIHDFFDGH